MSLRRWQREMGPPEPAPRPGYDPARLRRAIKRPVKKLGDHKFLVAGNDSPHYVVDLTQDVPCFCKDAEFHGRGCLHELAARLADGDVELQLAIGQMLVEAEKRLDELLAKKKRELRTLKLMPETK